MDLHESCVECVVCSVPVRVRGVSGTKELQHFIFTRFVGESVQLYQSCKHVFFYFRIWPFKPGVK